MVVQASGPPWIIVEVKCSRGIDTNIWALMLFFKNNSFQKEGNPFNPKLCYDYFSSLT